MSASLVGSEMCIRDRQWASSPVLLRKLEVRPCGLRSARAWIAALLSLDCGAPELWSLSPSS
eukprot:548623-Alexandrium_andersonii.AAC.1